MYRALLPAPGREAGRRRLALRCTTATATLACRRHPALPLRPFSSAAASLAKAHARRPPPPPSRQHAVPAAAGSARSRAHGSPPTRQGSPPARHGTPPARQGAPPKRQGSRKADQPVLDPLRFPAFPGALFSDRPADVEAGFQQISKALDLRLKITKDHALHSKAQHKCRIELELSKYITAVGSATALTKEHATKLAFDNVLRRLLNAGALAEIHTALEDELVPLLPKEKHESAYMQTKSDVYNFCAGLGLIPQFTYTPLKLKHVRLSGQRRLYRVAIAVPQLAIEIRASSADPLSADVAACEQFKAAVEEKIKAGTLKTADDDVDFKGLSVATAPDFLRFFRQKTRLHANMELDYKADYLKMSGMQKVNVHVNGKACDATVVMKPRSNLEKLAELVAAVQLARDEPQIVPAFQKALEEGGGRVRNEVTPVEIEIRDAAINSMWENSWLPKGLHKDPNARSATDEFESRRFDRRRLEPNLYRDNLNASLKRDLERFRTDPSHADLRAQLASLPMSQYREKVLAMIADTPTPYSIVVGATGSGKTTQVPQILLNDAIARGEGADCNIICTQPRRIAATSVARRVAVERGEDLGHSVGYQVRFDTKRPRMHGGITFCTTGILLEQLKADPDGVLNYASHILVDEVHERDLPIDFLMTVLKKAVTDRQARGLRVPKIVLMSATLDTDLFAAYLSAKDSEGTEALPAPSISVPGRTFPVESRFLDDIMADLQQSHGPEMRRILLRDPKWMQYLDSEMQMQRAPPSLAGQHQPADAAPVVDWSNKISSHSDDDQAAQDRLEAIVPTGIVAATIARIAETTESGAILAFLPGLQEILDTEKMLLMDDFKLGFQDATRFRIVLLHSSVPREDQAAAFDVPPPGCRKIILSTNIAETSVTVPDVQHVVDSGKLREKRYDQLTRISGLQVVWESKSNSKQRAGRAGRVQNGFYHALFARERHEQMPAVGLPELLRSDLQETILAIKKQRFQQRAADFLAEFIEPPSSAAVDAAVEHLTRLKALTRDEQLTPLGRLLAELPVHPSLGKMILMGVIFRCLDPLIIIGAAAAERSLFVAPLNAKTEARACHRAFSGHGSDHLTLLKAFNQLRFLRHEYSDRMAQDYAYAKFLHWGAFNTIHKTAQSILDVLVESGLAPKEDRMQPPANPRDWASWRQKATAVRGVYGPPSLNTNSQNSELVRGLIAAGLYPNLASNLRNRIFASGSEDKIILHPSSENATASMWPRGTLVAYGQLQRQPGGDTLFARDTTIVQPLTAFLLADSVEFSDGLPKLGGWLPCFVKGSSKSDDRSPWQRIRNAMNGLQRFKTSLDLMLDRAYSDLSALQRERSQPTPNTRSLLKRPRGSSALDPNPIGKLSQEDMLDRLPKAIVEILSLQPPTSTRPPPKPRAEGDASGRPSGDKPTGPPRGMSGREFGLSFARGRAEARNQGRDRSFDSVLD